VREDEEVEVEEGIEYLRVQRKWNTKTYAVCATNGYTRKMPKTSVSGYTLEILRPPSA
jgi:hypothetical protein